MKKIIIAICALAAAIVFMPAREVKAAYNVLQAGSHAQLLRSMYGAEAAELDFRNKYNTLQNLMASGASQSQIMAAQTAVNAASVKLAQINALITYQMEQSASFPVPSTYAATQMIEPIYAAIYADKSIYATAINNQAIYNSEMVNQAAYNAVLATNSAYAVDLANVVAYNAYYHGQAPYPR